LSATADVPAEFARPRKKYIPDSFAGRSPQADPDASSAIVHPPRSVISWRSYQRSGVRNTKARWGMEGPVFFTATTSSTGPPTFADWVATASTIAVRGSGVEHKPVARNTNITIE